MGAPPTQPGRLTDAEVRLAEQYVSMLDFVSRCAQAVDAGNWHYLRDKARQLEYAAERLTDIATETWQEIDAGGPRPRADRLLHPAEPHREGGGPDVA
jgi:hypothetical protein